MAQDVTLQGATYTAVPSIVVPKSGGGTASFLDTSDATATADKILSGYTAYAGGSLLTGTASGGGGSGWLPSSATLVASSDGILNFDTDLDWSNYTPSTTSKTLLSAGTARGICSYILSSSEYQNKAIIGSALYLTVIDYVSGHSAAKGDLLQREIDTISFYAPMTIRGSGTADYGRYHTTYAMTAYYRTSALATAVTVSAQPYGVGPSAACALTISSATSTSRTVGYARSAIIARCSSTTFATASAADVDGANSNVYYYHRLWLVDKEECMLYGLFDPVNGYYKNLP